MLPLPGSSAEEVCGLPGSLISALAKEDIHRLLRSLWGKQLGTAGVFAAGALGIASPLWMFGTILLAAFTFQRRDTVYADCCNAENQMRLPPVISEGGVLDAAIGVEDEAGLWLAAPDGHAEGSQSEARPLLNEEIRGCCKTA